MDTGKFVVVSCFMGMGVNLFFNVIEYGQNLVQQCWFVVKFSGILSFYKGTTIGL